MDSYSITVFKGDTSRLKNVIPIQERVESTFYQKEVGVSTMYQMRAST